MSKSIFRVIVASAVSGAIAGGAIALYGVSSHLHTRNPLELSPAQAALTASVLAIFAMVLAVSLVRWIPDNKTMPLEDAVLVVVGGLFSLMFTAVSFNMLGLATKVPQLWLVPAVVSGIIGALVGVLPVLMGLSAIVKGVSHPVTATSR